MNVGNSILTAEIQQSEEILAMERAQGVCFRCGCNDHFLKSCPEPFATVLAFAPDKKGGTKGRPSTTNVRIADEEQGVEEVEEVTEESSGQNTPEILIEQEGETEDQSPENEQSDAWGACWLDDLEVDATLTCTEVLRGDRVIVDIKSVPHATVPELVIDSGAASNVAGKEWILSWLKWGNVKDHPVVKKSSRKFRFGSGVIHPSEGTMELKG